MEEPPPPPVEFVGQLPAVVVLDVPAPLLDLNSEAYRRQMGVRRSWLNFVLLTCFLQARILSGGRAFEDDFADGTPNPKSLGPSGYCHQQLIEATQYPAHKYHSADDPHGEVMLIGEDINRLNPGNCLNDNVR